MIRPARETDAPAMAEVLSDWIDATSWMPRLYTREEDFAFCQNLLLQSQVWVADTAEGVGFLALHGDRIDALYVAPSIQKKGWGRALIHALRPTQKRLTLWTFQANSDAIAFYKAMDFQVAEVTNGQGNAEKLPDCFMTWERAAL